MTQEAILEKLGSHGERLENHEQRIKTQEAHWASITSLLAKLVVAALAAAFAAIADLAVRR